MSSISRVNEQLLAVGAMIVTISSLLPRKNDDIETVSRSLESLCKAQKALIETQAIIFVECTESEIDMPTLPLFIEERDESDSDE